MTIRGRSSRYLGAAVFSSAASFFMIPLVTRVLDAHDYGVFALVMAFTTGIASVATVGAGFVASNRLPAVAEPARREIVTALVVVTMITSMVGAIICVVAFVLARDVWGRLEAVPVGGAAMALGTALLLPLWLITVEIITVEGRAGAYALTSVGQTLALAATTLLGLFVWDMGLDALFLGALSSAVVGVVAASAVLLPLLSWPVERRELGQHVRDYRSLLVSQAAETAYAVLERALLAGLVGFRQLGYYSHSQSYRTLLHLGVKSVARGTWPVTLDEARGETSSFASTQRVWSVMHVLVTFTGLAAATVGDVAVRQLTNGKLTAAWAFIPAWIVVVLLQNFAKAQLGVVWTRAEARTLARLNLRTTALSLVLLLVLVPLVGAAGALAAVLVGAVSYRVGISALARAYRPTPFHDQWGAAGIVAIAVASGLKALLSPGTTGSILLLAAAVGIWAFVSRSVLADAARVLRPTRLATPTTPLTPDGVPE